MSEVIKAIYTVVLTLILSSTVYPQDLQSSARGFLDEASSFTCNFYCLMTYSIAAVAAILLVMAGARYLTSEENPALRDKAKKEIIYILAGLTFFLITPPVVKFLTGGTVTTFDCECVPGMEGVGPHITTTTEPGLRCAIIRPKTGSEHDVAYAVEFLGRAVGGKPIYYYRWESDKDGFLSDMATFIKTLTRNEHVITLNVTDSEGKTCTATSNISVIVPKPKPTS